MVLRKGIVSLLMFYFLLLVNTGGCVVQTELETALLT